MALVYDKFLLHQGGNIKLHQGGVLLMHTQHEDGGGGEPGDGDPSEMRFPTLASAVTEIA